MKKIYRLRKSHITTVADLTRVNCDVDGNPRYVVHFTELSHIDEDFKGCGLDCKYEEAISRSKVFGGKKYHNKSYGGGIVFTSYNVNDEIKMINKIKLKALNAQNEGR